MPSLPDLHLVDRHSAMTPVRSASLRDLSTTWVNELKLRIHLVVKTLFQPFFLLLDLCDAIYRNSSWNGRLPVSTGGSHLFFEPCDNEAANQRKEVSGEELQRRLLDRGCIEGQPLYKIRTFISVNHELWSPSYVWSWDWAQQLSFTVCNTITLFTYNILFELPPVSTCITTLSSVFVYI